MAGTLRTTLALGAIALVALTTVLYIRKPHATDSSPAHPELSSLPFGASASASAASSPARRRAPKDSHEWVQLVVESLAERTAPESLAAAALIIESNVVDFSSSAANRMRAELTSRAAAAAPNDPAIQLLALKACRVVYDCDGTRYENSLASADAANAWTRSPALRKAIAANDSAKQAEVLAQMAQAQRFDSYLARMEVLLDAALQSLNVPPPPDADWDGTPPNARLVSQTLNVSSSGENFGDVARACKPAVADSTIQNCRAIAKLMLNSDEDMVVRSGLELAATLYPAGSAEDRQIAKLQRRYDWQMYQVIRLPRSPEENARFVKGRLGDAKLRRELLQQQGIALEPPANWKNPFGSSR